MATKKESLETGLIGEFRAVLGAHLPESWELTTLGEAFKWGSGGTPKSTNPAYYDGDIPWLIIGDLNDDPVSESAKKITEEGLENSSAKWVEPGSVLLAMYGSIGKLGIAVSRLTTNQAIAFTKPEEDDPKYLFYYLMFVRNKLARLGKGATQKNISQTVIKAFPYVRAPMDQQSDIVAEIEKQFSRLDEAVASLKRVKANLKRYKAAVLKAAVEGKLTEEWRKQNPDVEPASKLLERILAERRTKWEEGELAKMKAKGKAPKDEKWKEKYRSPEPLRVDETFKIPATWVWTNLGQVSWSIRDGPHYSPKYSQRGIPFISGGNVRPEGIDFSSTKFIAAELHEKLSVRCKPRPGDLLYTKGGTTGIARYNTESRDFNVWVHVAVIRILQGMEGLYLQNALNSSHCYRQSQLYTHGVGNQDLGLTRMIKITLPLPPSKEQMRINSELDQIMSFFLGLEDQVNGVIKRAERLRQSILAYGYARKLGTKLE